MAVWEGTVRGDRLGVSAGPSGSCEGGRCGPSVLLLRFRALTGDFTEAKEMFRLVTDSAG